MAKASLRSTLRAPAGAIDLSGLDPRATPLAPGGKKATREALIGQGAELDELQERLYAEGTGARARRRVVLVLQGMDTSGKDGTIKHVAGQLNPQGVHIASFKQPTEEELEHHFLWRIRRQIPAAGLVGVFNRSHYEDVLVVRVHELVAPAVWGKRYGEINDFEAELAADGVTWIKVFLHISHEEQRERLIARLDDPTKRWKFNPSDVRERRFWADYQRAYADALERCSTDTAPWYVVPADRKWYRDWAVAGLVHETLRDLDPQYPRRRFDADAWKQRLQE